MLKLWMLCLMKASHKESKFLFNGKEIVVTSGQFVTGAHVIAKEFNEGVPNDNQIVWRTLWRWMKKFESEGMLTINSTTKYSVITINNWADYQVNDNPVTSARQSTDNQRSTYKNDKNDKNDKNINNNSRKSGKRTYDEDSIHYQLATLLFEEVKKNNSEARTPNFHTWSDDIRKMMELDGRKETQVRNMIQWSQEHEFWKGIILSAKKLREKYDQMKVQAMNPKPVKRGFNTPVQKKEVLPDWIDQEQSQEETFLDEEVQRKMNERLQKFREGSQ